MKALIQTRLNVLVIMTLSFGLISSVFAAEQKVTINPSYATLATGEKIKFNGIAKGLSNTAVKWSYSGCGWIEQSTGIYHAPEGMRKNQTVCSASIKATSVVKPSLTRTAEITVKLAGNKRVSTASSTQSKSVKTTNGKEHIWLHPSFKRRGDGELANFKFMTNSKTIKYYGMRYELPWSLFEKKRGQYNFSELDKVMKNAKQQGFKVYIVLHDKTWYYGNAITNTWPVPESAKSQSNYFTTKSNGKGHIVRVAKRWVPTVERWYLSALEAILKRRTVNADYSQLEVVSFGESSLSIGYKNINKLKNMGYPGQAWYKDYLIRLLQRSTDLSNQYYAHQGAVKIAMNLNWIPGQTKPGANGEWMQHEVLQAVKNTANAVQAIEDVHANGRSHLYKERLYKYTLDNKDRVVPKNKVWAHISCDTKRNGQSAAESLAMARAMAKNITIRHRCDARSKQKGSSFFQYEKLLK
ncbi:MAG: hypothetical protein V3U75_12670 [Methylococcaceae bacterium]